MCDTNCNSILSQKTYQICILIVALCSSLKSFMLISDIINYTCHCACVYQVCLAFIPTDVLPMLVGIQRINNEGWKSLAFQESNEIAVVISIEPSSSFTWFRSLKCFLYYIGFHKKLYVLQPPLCISTYLRYLAIQQIQKGLWSMGDELLLKSDNQCFSFPQA